MIGDQAWKLFVLVDLPSFVRISNASITYPLLHLTSDMCSDHDVSDTVSHRDTLPPPSVLRHVVDVHCHPTDSEIPVKIMDNLPIALCAMSTLQADQGLVRDLATAFPAKVVPCFG
jgi:hypothetical protein